MFDLSEKVAIVTGSSRGIGRAIAERMAEAGARVIVSSRKGEACAAVADAITEAGGEAAVIPCNISSKEELQNLVSKSRETFGRIDILVCNAATNPEYGPMHQISDEAFDKIMGTNVRSNFWLANMVAPEMAERGDGAIIIVSSIAGLAGSRNIGVYGISKAADFQLARNLAIEWGKKGIRANCIAPGLIRTDFARALWEDPKIAEYIEKQTPLGRIGDPDDIAGVAVFLAGRAGRFITGQAIVADGGATVSEPL
ncbi:MAG: SDR family oxidoreductase [Sphingomonadales bacterium]|nr:SDR family oxidoreductase [Sphingomonadales bacterium]